MLRSISCNKTALSPLLSKIISEFITSELTAVIRTQAFDVHAMLSLSPGCKVLIGFESLVFSVQYVQFGVVSAVISEGDIVAPASKTMGQ
jgi:hypothetical protein